MRLAKHFFWITLLTFVLAGCQRETGEIDRTGDLILISGTVRPNPIPVNFLTLNADPFTFVNRMIRVTGQYFPAAATPCYPFKGVIPSWTLVADGFEMEIKGLDQVALVAEPGTNLTIDGIWRRYVGPIGCGDELEEQTYWYLEVQQVVSPNPLGGQSFVAQAPSGFEGESSDLVIDPSQGVQPSATPTFVATIIATPSPNFVLTATAAAAEITPFSTPISTEEGTGLTPTPTGTLRVQSPTPLPTPGPGTPSATPTWTPVPGAGETATPDNRGGGLGGAGSGTRVAVTPFPTDTPLPYGAPVATDTPRAYP